MSKFLLEILTEEIPSSMQIQAHEDIRNIFTNELNMLEITFSSIKVFSTPRRLVVYIDGLIDYIKDKTEEKKGPRVDANKQSIEGFLKTYSLKLEDCQKKETPKGEFYFYNQVIKGGEVKLVIVNVILNVLKQMKFKKSMVWNNTKVAWARPIRGFLSFFNEEVLNFNYAGVSSSNKTQGHRFLGEKDILIKSIEDYFNQLEKNYVILDANKRKEIILNKLTEITKEHKVSYINNDGLINEILYLVEYPNIFVAEIPQKYMSLPKELLVEIIVKNQRYINLINKDESLYTKYVIVSNLIPEDNGEVIIAGNNKVLQARLEDGLFFYNNDLKTTLKEKSQKLKSINFFEGLGSIYDKTKRVSNLFKEIFKEDQSFLCELYKADLTSEVVVEIPELQGIMGYYYAKHEGLNNEQCLAIKNHYKPQGAADSLPEDILGAKLSLIDKLDTLISFFSINKKPSGSKDPFALRRAAIGIIRIIEKFEFNIDIGFYISKDLKLFLQERVEYYLSNYYQTNIIKNIIEKRQDLNILSIINDVKNLDSLLKSPFGVKTIMIYKRVFNILKSSKKAENLSINQELLLEKQEISLFEAYLKTKKAIDSLPEQNKTKQSLESLSELQPLVDNFLDSVQININDNNIKNNRTNILFLVLNLCDNVLNFKNMIL